MDGRVRVGLEREIFLDDSRVGVDVLLASVPSDNDFLSTILGEEVDHVLLERSVDRDLLALFGMRDGET